MSSAGPRVAILTGAASRIGRALAQALATAGYSLELIDIDGEELGRFEGALRGEGVAAHANAWSGSARRLGRSGHE